MRIYRYLVAGYTAAVVTAFVPGFGYAEENCASKLAPTSDIPTILECMLKLQTAVNISSKNTHKHTFAQVPSGAVIAFDRPNGCPNEWENFDVGAGRFIVGVGGKYELPYAGDVPKYMIGGEEKVTLESSHIPGSSGPVRGSTHDRFVPSTERLTALLGAVFPDKRTELLNLEPRFRWWGIYDGSEPHDNMPPYIALLFCKKP